MAVQLEGGFLSDNGGEYDVYIYNDSFAGSTSSIEVNNLNIEWESQGDKIMEPLKASRCSFSFINNSTEVDTFITNLVNGNEDQFKLKVDKESDLFWCGVILADQVSFEDMPKGRIVTVTAIDGIGRLEDITFDYDDAVTNTMLKYIYEALEYNGLSDFWSGTDVYFKESSEFYETQMTNNGTQYSPFLQSRFDRTLFLTDEVSGDKTITSNIPGYGKSSITLPTYTPVTCAEVLRQILLINSCRMFMSDGSYYIQQVRNFNGATYNQRSIRKDLLVASYQSAGHRLTEGTEVKRLGGARWTYFPPLQEVLLNSVPRNTLAQTGGGIQDINTLTIPLVQTVDLGTLRGGSGSGKTIRIYLNLVNQITASATVFTIEINIEAGSYRLKSTNAKPDIVEWTTTATDRVYRVISGKDIITSGASGVYIDVETPEFPSTIETSCSMSVTYDSPNMTSLENITAYPVELLLLVDGAQIQEAQYKVDNTVSNSVIIEYPTPLLNDLSYGFSSKNSFEVNSTGSTWVNSEYWDAGYSADVSLVETLCLETMSFQDKAVEVLQGTLKVPKSYIAGGTTPYAPMFHLTYYYESKTFVFNGGRLNCLRDEFTGEWFRSIQDKSGWSIQQDSGDGSVYNKDIKIGTPKKKVYDNDYWTKQAMFTLVNKQLATLDENLAVASGPFTSFSITSLDRDVYDGDVVTLIHPVNNRVMDTFTLSADAAASDVELTVDSKTPAEDIPAGALIVFNGETLRDSGIFRTTSSSTPPTGGFGGNGAIQVHLTDGKLYYQSNGDTYEVQGTIKL